MIRYVKKAEECFTGKDPLAIADVFRISPQLCRHWTGRTIYVPVSTVNLLIKNQSWTRLNFYLKQLKRLRRRLAWTLLIDVPVHRRIRAAYERFLR